jgi:hypothetical protein
VALCLPGLLALALHLIGSHQANAAHEALEGRMRAAVPEIERIARDASALGALDDPDEQERSRRLVRLLHGERLPCTPRLDEVALVPLLEPGAGPSRTAPGYAIPLDRPQHFHLLRPVRAAALTARTALEPRAERRDTPRALGHLGATAADGTHHEFVLEAPASGAGDGVLVSSIPLPHAGPWTALEWTPRENAPRATLLGLEARDEGGSVEAIPLSGISEDGIPILAHARGPQYALAIEPGTSVVVALPELAAADRLWVVLSAERAYPTLAGDDLLALLEVEYAEGEPSKREVRNGIDLVAQRLPAGLERPAGLRSRLAYRWSDAGGVTNAHALLPVRLDPGGRPRALAVRNLGPGGRLTLLAATLARTRAPALEGPLAVTVIEDNAERVELRPPLPAWRDLVMHQGEAAVRLAFEAPTAPRSTGLVLAAPEPPEAGAARRRTQTALLTCLAIGVFLCVLLAVDALDRARRLAWRLALGVLAAALVPLAATIWLVERGAVARAEGEQTARARAALEVAQETLRSAQRRTQDVVRQLAGELSGDVASGEGPQLERLVRVTLGVLPEAAPA